MMNDWFRESICTVRNGRDRIKLTVHWPSPSFPQLLSSREDEDVQDSNIKVHTDKERGARLSSAQRNYFTSLNMVRFSITKYYGLLVEELSRRIPEAILRPYRIDSWLVHGSRPLTILLRHCTFNPFSPWELMRSCSMESDLLSVKLNADYSKYRVLMKREEHKNVQSTEDQKR